MNTEILFQDSYKYSHFMLYPPDLTSVTTYIEPRGPAGSEVLFAGLQHMLKTNLNQPLTYADVAEIESYIVPHGLPFNKEGFYNIVNKHGGFLPLEIQALPEGIVSRAGVPQIQYKETDPDYAWLPSFVETTAIRDGAWYCSTVATISWEVKQICKAALSETSDNPEAINFMLHDFGFRAASSFQSGAIGGFGHLVNFMGTDTTAALRVARQSYNEFMAGYSVIATEHSIATIWGPLREGGYIDAVLTALESAPESNPFPIASIVSDSYDLWNFVNTVVLSRKDRISKLRGRLVIRPDSGDPLVVPVRTIGMLGEIFGYTINSKGYKVLPNYIRVIQGDGVNRESIKQILQNLKRAGWAADNIVFGMGGKLIGAPQRDDFKYAQKVNSATLADGVHDVYKNPITDPGKASKPGRQAVVIENGKLMAIEETQLKGRDNMLKTVWRNGELLVDHTLAEMRARSNS